MSAYTKTEEHFVSSDPLENLAAAIIIKAVEDWRRAIRCQHVIWGEHLMVQDRQAMLDELRAFFLSDWCAVLCPIPPSDMLLRLEREYAESALRKIGLADKSGTRNTLFRISIQSCNKKVVRCGSGNIAAEPPREKAARMMKALKGESI